jgi:uncharacterized protein (TIGR00251 family)
LPAPASSFYRASAEGLLLFLRVTPNAGRDVIDGVETRDDNSTVLRIRVAAVPDKGRANAAVIALLAKQLRLPKSSMTLVSGETARMKTVLVEGSFEEIASKLATLS